MYITDDTCRHEVTSWRLDDNAAMAEAPEHIAPAGFTSHVVLLVDSSGSMRRDDVPGYESRTDAVYSCLRREFLAPQLAAAGRGRLGQAVVSLITMNDQPTVRFQRVPVDEALDDRLSALSCIAGRSHGNYLPALEAIKDLLQADKHQDVQIVVMFLSDGAPSDHGKFNCKHGVPVWSDTGAFVNGRNELVSCGLDVRECRQEVKAEVGRQCCQAVRDLGDTFGRDRFSLHTVGFGPATEEFQVLADMAAMLPRPSSFQKLGLAANRLSTVFSSLSSTLTTMRTEAAGSVQI